MATICLATLAAAVGALCARFRRWPTTRMMCMPEPSPQRTRAASKSRAHVSNSPTRPSSCTPKSTSPFVASNDVSWSGPPPASSAPFVAAWPARSWSRCHSASTTVAVAASPFDLSAVPRPGGWLCAGSRDATDAAADSDEAALERRASSALGVRHPASSTTGEPRSRSAPRLVPSTDGTRRSFALSRPPKPQPAAAVAGTQPSSESWTASCVWVLVVAARTPPALTPVQPSLICRAAWVSPALMLVWPLVARGVADVLRSCVGSSCANDAESSSKDGRSAAADSQRRVTTEQTRPGHTCGSGSQCDSRTPCAAAILQLTALPAQF